ncbi:hypothetical protein EYF80_050889 [Liparis tanakae]|uniref:Uncharacterized protein n=1 Tax=Liparis tanakae TaxID=230148 RepID=A0A4Z2FCQ6_9TELE|nr:hypothetical protein EYF80_050889 [Liparis tanakae]
MQSFLLPPASFLLPPASFLLPPRIPSGAPRDYRGTGARLREKPGQSTEAWSTEACRSTSLLTDEGGARTKEERGEGPVEQERGGGACGAGGEGPVEQESGGRGLWSRVGGACGAGEGGRGLWSPRESPPLDQPTVSGFSLDPFYILALNVSSVKHVEEYSLTVTTSNPSLQSHRHELQSHRHELQSHRHELHRWDMLPPQG